VSWQVKELQYDPVSVRAGDGSLMDRWLATLDSWLACRMAVERGLSVDGDRVMVRQWEEVAREEAALHEWMRACGAHMQESERNSHVLHSYLQKVEA